MIILNDFMILSIIVPVYNEEKLIKDTLNSINEFFLNKLEFEIIVVNDGSNDLTEKEIKNTSYKRLKYLKNINNEGKGSALIKGIKKSVGKYVLFTDADLSTPLSEYEKLLYEIKKNNCSVAIGSRKLLESRIIKKQPLTRIILGRFFNFFVRSVLSVNYTDTQCGFKLFEGDLIRKIIPLCKIKNFAIDAEILFLLKKYNFKVKEIGVLWKDNNLSSVNLITDSLNMLIDLFRIRFSNYRNIND